MCRISKEMVIRANTKTKGRSFSDMLMSVINSYVIVISTHHFGIDYIHNVTVKEFLYPLIELQFQVMK